MGIIVMACYRPKRGMERELEALTAQHAGILRQEGLVTERPAIIARSRNGTVIEVFEWTSQQAIDHAHENERVGELWDRYGELSEFVRMSDVPEASDTWASFTPLDARAV